MQDDLDSSVGDDPLSLIGSVSLENPVAIDEAGKGGGRWELRLTHNSSSQV
jgi:hypothetical protein